MWNSWESIENEDCSSECKMIWARPSGGCHEQHRWEAAILLDMFSGRCSIHVRPDWLFVHSSLPRQIFNVLERQPDTRPSDEACHQGGGWIKRLPYLWHWLPRLLWPVFGYLAILSLVYPSHLMSQSHLWLRWRPFGIQSHQIEKMSFYSAVVHDCVS
jgi:hypothetical protein